MNSLQAQLLIAVPELADTNFFRSVVLLIQHDEVGATGVILNRPSNVTVADVWSEVSETPCDCQQFIHVGGPVEGPLISVHTSLTLGETPLLPGIFVSMGRENLDKIVNQELQSFKLFSGYSGWGAGQLEGEIDAGGWLTMPAETEHIFASPDELWKQVCESFGAKLLQAHFGKHLPSDPSLN